MEERKNIFDYAAQVLALFGSMIFMMNIFCILFGEGAQEISSLYALGKRGIPVEVIFQFLGIAVLITLYRAFFFTDVIIKKMPIAVRTVCLLLIIIVTITVFVIIFQWFPMNMWEPWVMFFICFIISFAVSFFVMILKEKVENKKMEEALKKIKREGGRA